MSEPLRIAAAVEGPTDSIVVRAILNCVLADTEFEFHTLQPEESVAFGSVQSGTAGLGWVGVYRWSRQTVCEGGGSVSGSFALSSHDVVIVQVDADLAGKTYGSGRIQDPPRLDLPCKKTCPPGGNDRRLEAGCAQLARGTFVSAKDRSVYAFEEYGSAGARCALPGQQRSEARRLGVPCGTGTAALNATQADQVPQKAGRLST